MNGEEQMRSEASTPRLTSADLTPVEIENGAGTRLGWLYGTVETRGGCGKQQGWYRVVVGGPLLGFRADIVHPDRFRVLDQQPAGVEKYFEKILRTARETEA